MLTKTWNPDRENFDVLFDLPSALDIDHAAVVGEFNSWDPDADQMTKDEDGRWVATLSLEPGKVYRFRYHLGGDRWENDWSADDYADNEFGGSDSVVHVPDAPSEPPAVKGGGSSAGSKKASTKKKAPAKKAAKKAATKKQAAAQKRTGAKKAAAKKTAKKASKRPAPGSGAE